ncbi:MAG: hypothetical protein CLLPBCKN_002829 [Chroococcidiopsis cubana SAG 39.79]|nr:hypothetical protein [Chroococcidiopsis cubana SAG 39.79]
MSGLQWEYLYEARIVKFDEKHFTLCLNLVSTIIGGLRYTHGRHWLDTAGSDGVKQRQQRRR